ncbi:MAG: 50S ribosomal protein L6 [Candidatus Harrisonbacteria bacterium CG10_big_fil_rev_8_21_14_0_10_49_15]|uniref:Large ribosomal subunit protein uL6 n=1 Tax=Candidatus Harrisonbacteria bacterium CG10_big_fil_rev_8_21_14_0_10_49_15 TaxID=1974587 RepID=A0A2H0UKY2_9BACT|nr:MAG: 50S ribosomal protein L6 [Candidatus Harrisonbacteria bacterium CG10_big_fil_rev_8_21_14_0_10_49_15]
MSKIGRKPIEILEGVTVSIEDGKFKVAGKLGTLETPILAGVTAEQSDPEKSQSDHGASGTIVLKISDDNKQTRANWGTTAALLRNAITGVSEGFKKDLEIQGVGFRASMEGKTLVMGLGFSHPVRYETPEGVTIAVEKNVIIVTGIDSAVVGQTAAEIRKFKKPEPYQGKGIRYVGEHVRRKQGKKVAGSA